MTEKCLFCDKEFSKVKNSKEHIFRKKNRDLFGSKNTVTKVIQAAGDAHKSSASHREYPLSPFEQTVRDICSGCNNGWMNGIDDNFEKLQYRLVKNLSVFAGEIELQQIRLWAYKTALVRTILDEKSNGSMPYHHFHKLYKNRDLSDDICIWLFNSHNPIDTYSRHTWGGIDDFEYHQVTMSIGAMAVYVFMSNSPISTEIKTAIENDIQNKTNGRSINIWPLGKSFVWPASMVALSHNDISDIATTAERIFNSSNNISSLMTHAYMLSNFQYK
ncbi:hypothetical protein ACU6QH_04325 [Aeromonas veronii]|uniref:hypothetical protein n=1 Tax=Aeromonas veronii TaxID=654 RepID=UPI00406BE34F